MGRAARLVFLDSNAAPAAHRTGPPGPARTGRSTPSRLLAMTPVLRPRAVFTPTLIAAAVAGLVCASALPRAFAQSAWTSAPPYADMARADWFNAANWSAGVPGAGTAVTVNLSLIHI